MMKRFKIKSISLQNITTHDNTQLTLPVSGSMALVGPNGAGKSSIIEAIYAALTLKSLRGGDYDLVTKGRKNASIRLKMEADEDTLEAIVRYEVADKRKSKNVILKYNGKLVASTPKEYTTKIAEILGIRNIKSKEYGELITSTTLIPQGGLREIAAKMSKPSEFKKLIETAIGLPDYRKAIEQLNSLSIEHENLPYPYPIPRISSKDIKKIALSRRYRDLNNMLEQIRDNIIKNEERLEKAKTLISILEKQLEEIRRDLEEVEAKIQYAEKEKAGIESEIRELYQKKEKLRELEIEYQRVKEKLRLAILAKERLEKTKIIAGLQRDLNKLYALLAEKSRLESSMRELEVLIEDLELLRETERDAREYEKLDRTLKEFEEKQLEIEKRKTALEERLSQLQNRITSLRKLVRDTLNLVELTTSGEIDEDIEKIKEKYKALENEDMEIREELESIIKERASVKSKIEEARKALETLEKSLEPKCPVCGRPLTLEQKHKIISELKNKIKNSLLELERLERIEEELYHRRKRLDELLEQIKANLNLIETLRREVDFDAYRKLSNEIDKLSEMLMELTNDISSRRERLRDLERSWRLYHSILERLSKKRITTQNLKKLKEDYNNIKRKLKALTKEIEILRNKILSITKTNNINEANVVIGKAVEEASQLSILAGQVEVLDEQLKRIEKQIGEILDDIKKLSTLEHKLKELADTISSLNNLRKELETRKEDITNEIIEARKDVENATAEIERLKQETRSWEEVKRKLITASVAGAILLDVQEKLLENARISIEESMTDILEKFGLEYHAVDINDVGTGFEVIAISRRGNIQMPVSALSGGEQTALALAYVIALQRTLALRTGFLILDEPTSELDAERRDTLMELIGKISSEGVAEQLIVVTHHEEVIDKVDQVCRVEKPGGISKVVCEEG